MKFVFYLEENDWWGGNEVLAERQARKLRAEGHGVLFLHRPDAAVFAGADRIVVHKCLSPEVLALFPPEKTDVWLHDHEAVCPRWHGYPPFRWSCNCAAGWWPCLFCAPVCRDWRGALERLAGQRRRLDLLRRMRRLVVVSRFMKGRLVANGLPAEKIAVEPPELPEGEPAPLPPGTAQPDLLYAGQLLRGKGVQVLLRALAGMDAARTLDVAGKGPYGGPLAALAERLGLGGRVRWHGWVPDARSWMAAARCVVVPSVWPEPYGLVAAEAVALGRPVVASDTGGLPEACGGKAVLVPPNDPQALARALEEVPP